MSPPHLVHIPGYVTFNHSCNFWELCHAKTIVSASQLEAHLQAFLVEKS
jgi:hypothetical protein